MTTTYRAALINEATLQEEAVAFGATREEALSKIDWERPGYDANVTRLDARFGDTIPSNHTGLSGCGVHSFYVD